MTTTTKFQLVDINKLVPYANNARTHNKEQILKLRSSLREFGFVDPVVIDKNYTILAGHGRIMAAKEEGIKEVPCVFVDHMTEAQKKAYILTANRTALDAGWDEELLAVEMEELQNLGFDLGLTGFDEKEIADLFAIDSDEAKEDNFDVDAELEKPCKSKTGDIWHLGKHTVICGDSTLPETYTALLGDTKVNLVCTDPPYLVNLESTSGKIKNDDLDDEKGYEFLKSAFERFKESMAKDASIYVFYATSKARVFHDAYEDAGFKVGAGLVWKKDRLVLTRTDWKYIHEPIIWGWRKDGKHIWYGDQKQKTVFEFDRIKNSKEDGCGHPSSKPVPLIAYLISQCTQTNGMVLDGFLGSASTLIACEQLNRVCFGVELEPKFVDVAVERYIKLHEGRSDDVYLMRNGERIEYKDVEVGMLSGILPVWKSEIEPFPIAVTEKRLPFVKHLGDINCINGAEIEPVDIITFGSPCTDLSVAGKRQGLNAARSGLFFQAVRIIKEMRCATNGKYPRFAVWENVVGALSSNKGEDFRCVLKELCKIKIPDISVPKPEKWTKSGEILADGFSLAYRTVDAQYWGVPQRRMRIYLVADFDGECASKILFESESLSGYSPQSFCSWKETAGSFGTCSEETSTGLVF